MKKLFFIFFSLLACLVSFSQYVYKIKADSVLITNDSCNAELNIENSTRNVCGFLFNKGNGRTEFRSALIKLNDSTYVSGCDTLHLRNNSNTSAVSSVTYVTADYTISGEDDNIVVNANNVTLTFPNPALSPGKSLTISHEAFFGTIDAGPGISFGGSYLPVYDGANHTVAGQNIYTTATYVSDGSFWRKANSSRMFFPESVSSGGQDILINPSQVAYSQSGLIRTSVVKGLKAGAGINLSSDANDITISLVGGDGGDSSVNIYNSDGALQGDRTVDLNSHNLSFNQAGQQFLIANTGSAEEYTSINAYSTESVGAYSTIGAYSNSDWGYQFRLISSGPVNTTELIGDAGSGTISMYAPNGLNFGTYGYGAHVGTATRGLAVDGSGNVIEVTLPEVTGEGGTTIYTSDGTYIDNQNRTINQNGYSTAFVNGNFGIGINPSELLEVYDGNDDMLRITSQPDFHETYMQARNGDNSSGIDFDVFDGFVGFDLFGGTDTSYMEIYGDAMSEKINIAAPRGIVFNDYGVGLHKGTATYFLGVDGDGNVIETTVGGCSTGAEMITNGEFTTDASSWTTSDGDLPNDNWYYGEGNIFHNPGGSGTVYQLNPGGLLINDSTYLISLDISEGTGSVSVEFGSNEWHTFSAGAGTVTFTEPWTEGSETIIQIQPSSDFEGTIDNVSAKQQTCTGGGGGSGVNIYNSDGTVTASRTVNLNSHQLVFTDSNGTTLALNPGDRALQFNSPGYNTQVGMGDDFNGVYMATGSGGVSLFIRRTDSTINMLGKGVNIGGDPVFEGTPVPARFSLNDGTHSFMYEGPLFGEDMIIGDVTDNQLDIFGAFAKQELILQGTTNNTYLDIEDGSQTINLFAANGINFGGYGTGTHVGTVARGLAVDASGNVIEISLPEATGESGTTIYTSDGTYIDNQNRTINQNGYSTAFVNGNFGIGITPSELLEVYDGNDDMLRITSQPDFHETYMQARNGDNSSGIDFDVFEGFVGFDLFGGTDTSSMEIYGDAISEKINISAPRGIVFNDYGLGLHTGTPAYHLAVDSLGNVIEDSASAGGTTIYSGDGTITDNVRNVDLFTNSTQLRFQMSSDNNSYLLLNGGDNSDRTLIFSSPDRNSNQEAFVAWGYDNGGIVQFVASYDSSSRTNMYMSYDGTTSDYAQLQLYADANNGHSFWLNVNGEAVSIFGNLESNQINYTAGTHQFFGNFQVLGGNVSVPVSVIPNSDYTVSNGDYTIDMTITDSDHSITLPDATTNTGRLLIVMNDAESSFNLTVNTVSGQHINDISSGSLVLGRGYTLTLQSNGTKWLAFTYSSVLD